MHDALKHSLHCNEEPYNIESAQTWITASCDIGLF